MSTLRGLSPEDRALASEVYALWRDLAALRANPYGDHRGCLLAGRMALDATRWEDGFVILDAIRQRMDHESSPRWIPEWARELGGSKREAARVVERRQQRDAMAEVDPEALGVMRSVAAAKARGQSMNLGSVTCAVCKQFTETKCPRCGCALHTRSCPSRHECAA